MHSISDTVLQPHQSIAARLIRHKGHDYWFSRASLSPHASAVTFEAMLQEMPFTLWVDGCIEVWIEPADGLLHWSKFDNI